MKDPGCALYRFYFFNICRKLHAAPMLHSIVVRNHNQLVMGNLAGGHGDQMLVLDFPIFPRVFLSLPRGNMSHTFAIRRGSPLGRAATSGSGSLNPSSRAGAVSTGSAATD